VQYHFDDFSGCLNQTFTLELDDASTYPLKLISVDKHPGRATSSEHEAFSIVFRGANPGLEQQIYHIKHDTLGAMELFIVPIGPDDEGMCYEAVFA